MGRQKKLTCCVGRESRCRSPRKWPVKVSDFLCNLYNLSLSSLVGRLMIILSWTLSFFFASSLLHRQIAWIQTDAIVLLLTVSRRLHILVESHHSNVRLRRSFEFSRVTSEDGIESFLISIFKVIHYHVSCSSFLEKCSAVKLELENSLALAYRLSSAEM